MDEVAAQKALEALADAASMAEGERLQEISALARKLIDAGVAYPLAAEVFGDVADARISRFGDVAAVPRLEPSSLLDLELIGEFLPSDKPLALGAVLQRRGWIMATLGKWEEGCEIMLEAARLCLEGWKAHPTGTRPPEWLLNVINQARYFSSLSQNHRFLARAKELQGEFIQLSGRLVSSDAKSLEPAETLLLEAPQEEREGKKRTYLQAIRSLLAPNQEDGRLAALKRAKDQMDHLGTLIGPPLDLPLISNTRRLQAEVLAELGEFRDAAYSCSLARVACLLSALGNK
ncbi:MAG: hypothetical protein Q7T11_04450, partial [Deltaproteobacteria bacterium]|nr:hypothetical protein [Deltaproteobacteria bacterium]